MAQIIPNLQAIAKQNLQVELGGNLFTLDILQTQGCMSMNLVSQTAGVNVIGQRCNANCPIIPFPTLENGAGNFIFLTQNDALPDYEQFGKTQNLYYITNAELVALRTQGTPIILATVSAAGHAAGVATVAGVGAHT